MRGSSLVSTADLSVSAGRDLQIDAAQNTFSRDELHKEKNHDFTGVLTGNKLGLDDMTGNQHLSTSSQNHTGDSSETTLTGSTLGSSAGNVSLNAGRTLGVTACDLVSTQSMSLTGANVTLAAGMASASQNSTDESRSLAVGRVVGGMVIDSINTMRSAIKAANSADDPRLKAVKWAQAALAGYNLGGAASDAYDGLSDDTNKKAASASSGSLIKIGTELASTHNTSTSEYDSQTAKQSSLTAGKTLTIIADGSAPGTAGDIHVIGSSLKAADTLLQAKNNITLESAQSTANWANDSNNDRTAIGVSFNIGQQNGFTLDLGASIAKSMGTGDSVTQVNSTLDTGSLVLRSGQDTTLAGAQVRAQSIKADIGGNLTITSRQDSETQKSEQGSAGFGGSICIPPFCYGSPVTASASLAAGNMNSNYEAVTDQSGLFAGAGGYNIHVGDKTTLQGAVIASEASADKNLLNTNRLIVSDIKNTSDIKSQSAGLSVSGSSSGGGRPTASLGGLFGIALTDSDHSKTRSAVSEGTIVVRSAEGANDVVGLNRDTANANQKLDKPDEKAMQERMELVKSSVELANDLADAIATAKMKAAQDSNSEESKAARQALLDKGNADPTKEQIADQVSREYGVGSSFRKAAQAVTAIVQGVAGGNIGGAVAGASAPYLAQEIKTLTNGDDTAGVMAHAVLGAVIAGASGNSALAGAAGAGAGEYIAKQLHPNKSADELTETEKQTISALSTLAGGLAGGAVGGDLAGAAAGAQSGRNATENNELGSRLFAEKRYRDYAEQSCGGVAADVCRSNYGKKIMNEGGPVVAVLAGTGVAAGVVLLGPELMLACGMNPKICTELGIAAVELPFGAATTGGTALGMGGFGSVASKEVAAAADATGAVQGAKGLGSKVDDLLPNLSTRVLTETEARALGGENKGLIYVAEGPKGKPAAQDFQAGTNGAFTDLATGKGGVPALRYTNSNEKGVNFVKFDGIETAVDGSSVMLIDAKTKLAIWSPSTQKSVLDTLQRVRSAVDQNPGYKVVYEFPNQKVEAQAKAFIRSNNFDSIVSTRTRTP